MAFNGDATRPSDRLLPAIPFYPYSMLREDQPP